MLSSICNNPLKTLIAKVRTIDNNTNYFFIRTERGHNFNTYIKHGFIAIGWNQITIDDIRYFDQVRLKSKLQISEKIDISTEKGKCQITSTLNKLKIFHSLKKGDVIITPSYNSLKLGFGLVDDDKIYIEKDDLCIYKKRRKINWLSVIESKKLDPIFSKIKNNRYALSKINQYAEHIDSVTNNLYIRDSFSYYTININPQNNINSKILINFVACIEAILKNINTTLKLNEDIESYQIKINLQSPGYINLKIQKGHSLIIFAAILNIHCTGNINIIDIPQDEKAIMIQLIDENIDILENLTFYGNTIEMNWNRVNNTFDSPTSPLN